MNPRWKKRIKRVAIVIIALYLVCGIVLYLIQDKMLFHPKALPKNHRFSFNQPFEELNISFVKDNLSIVKFKPTSVRKGIVLFYHGNMKNVEHYKKYPDFFFRNGFEIWMIDYPGFGKTTGKRSEKIINEQALVMYGLAIKEISSDSIVIYGKSIGTGIASYVAANRTCRQLILETPYYNIPSLAKHYFPFYPVNTMIKYSFPINEYVKQAKVPIRILHGTHDRIIPYKHSKWLKAQNPGIELTTIKKGRHNNLSAFKTFQLTLDSLLKY